MRRRRRKREKFLKFRLKPKTKRSLKRIFLMLLFTMLGLAVFFHFFKLKKADRYKPSVPFAKKPGLIFVVDDIGHTRRDESLLFELGPDVTYAILPFIKYTRYFGELSRKTGAEVILHLPLESATGIIPGPGMIHARMSRESVLELLARDLASVPYRVGVNNHMGSGGTSNQELMRTVLGELKRRGLFFLDSGTTSKSVAPGIGYQLGVPVLRRDVFLDNEDSKEAVRKKVRELAQIARKKGYAIGIGHYRTNTLSVLKEEIPRLKRSGFQIFSLSDLVG